MEAAPAVGAKGLWSAWQAETVVVRPGGSPHEGCLGLPFSSSALSTHQCRSVTVYKLRWLLFLLPKAVCGYEDITPAGGFTPGK